MTPWSMLSISAALTNRFKMPMAAEYHRRTVLCKLAPKQLELPSPFRAVS